MTSFRFLILEVQGRIATVRLNRPEKRNALNYVVIRELKEAFTLLESDPDVKVILLKANGPAFCAGADLEYLEKLQSYGFNENLMDSTHLMELYLLLYKLKKIVIAQVEGPAIAGGCGLATLADFCYAVPDAKFGYPEVKIGFIPAIVMYFLIRKLGEGRARELLLSGDIITAQRAVNIGLITDILPAELIEKRVDELAERLCTENSQGSMEFTKRMMSDLQDMPLTEALRFSAKMNAHARDTAEFKIGIHAFLHKEKPQW